MDLSKLKARKAEEHFASRRMYDPEERAHHMRDFDAGWAAAEELYRPLLEAMSELVDLVDFYRDGSYQIDAFTTQPARAALESLRKAEKEIR